MTMSKTGRPAATRRVPTVTIIGAGEIGRAVNYLLTKKGLAPSLWDRDPERNPCALGLGDVVPAADFVFVCVPSWALRDCLRTLRPLLRRDAIVVSLSKGIEAETNATMDRLLAEALPRGQRHVFLAGPMLAEEIMQDLGAAAVAASRNKAAREAASALFAGSALRVEQTADLVGVTLASVLKNVYAVCLGIADGLNWGDNRKGWLTGVAIREMTAVLADHGAAAATVYSAAGIADLVSTGFSRYSSNHELGDHIVKLRRADIKSEGAVSIRPLLALLGRKRGRYPLLSLLAGVVLNRRDPHLAFERFFYGHSR
jgi:glycerol-3-phosphate dehydrogenase (NAD(P)+)